MNPYKKEWDREEWTEVAREAIELSHPNANVIIFADGSISKVVGSWGAQKPVVIVLSQKYNEKDLGFVLDSIEQGLEEVGTY